MDAERFMLEDLMNFTLDVCEEEDVNESKTHLPSSYLDFPNLSSQHPDEHLPDCAEEELEWLSNKDVFPAVETCLDILSDNPGITLNHHSPVSVLENSTSTENGGIVRSTCCAGTILVPAGFPVKARSKRRWRRRLGFPGLPVGQCWWRSQAKVKSPKKKLPLALPPPPPTIGRRCHHCLVETTPQWRAGPMGPKTLCNACGVRYKSGRLVPEYRPANSPTFSSKLHSNSHRKVMEMRRQKQVGGMART